MDFTKRGFNVYDIFTSRLGLYILLNIILIGFVNAVAVYCILGVRDGIPQSQESPYVILLFPPTIRIKTTAAKNMASIATSIAKGDKPEEISLIYKNSLPDDDIYSAPVRLRTAGEKSFIVEHGNIPNTRQSKARIAIPAIIDGDDSFASVA